MAKAEETIEIEKALYKATNKMGVFGCLEVTIGWKGNERVDYLTMDTKGVWRCYEIKVTRNDFYSKANNTFIGNYNYYVMPSELYDRVKKDIPNHVGVLDEYCNNLKKPTKQELAVDEDILKNSMIRSLSREVDKKAENLPSIKINGLRIGEEYLTGIIKRIVIYCPLCGTKCKSEG